MGLPRTLMAAAVLALGPGCAGKKLWNQDSPVKMPEGVPTSPLSPSVLPHPDVVQASATVPAAKPAHNPLNPFGKPGAKGDPKKVPATEMTILWRNRIDYLPDPTKNGSPNPGLVGQMFLLGPLDQFAYAEGKLVVALYDETPRPPGAAANKPEGWEFNKEALKTLLTPDERFGACYALFLPWPTYRPDVTRVRIAARFEPENGFPVYAQETRITIDTSLGIDKGAAWTTQQLVPGQEPVGGFNPLGGPPPAAAPGAGPGLGVTLMGGPPPGGVVPSAGPVPMPLPPVGTLQPAPPNYGTLTPAPGSPGTPINPANIPPSLQPIAFTVPRQQ
jgi:hypothetical protein